MEATALITAAAAEEAEGEEEEVLMAKCEATERTSGFESMVETLILNGF